ncbi:MAG: hypothetical protein LBL08_03725, partial [Candidatus Nomurabacteria bacterium]|nr:hypothetical protein [Candidatus Nomurabacteria bacterium]
MNSNPFADGAPKEKDEGLFRPPDWSSEDEPVKEDKKVKKTKDPDQDSDQSFLKKHLHALIAVITAIIFVLIVILIDLLMNHVFLTTSASGLEVNMQTNDQGQELPT